MLLVHLILSVHWFLRSRYDTAMAGPKAEEVTGDFEQFKTFMRRLMRVPHSEVKAKLDAEEEARKSRPKRPGRPPKH